MLMNKLKGDCFIGHDTNFIVQILVKIQIFALVGGGGGGGGGGDLSSTRPTYKSK